MRNISTRIGSLVTIAVLAGGCAGVLPQKSASERLGISPSMTSYKMGYAMHMASEMELNIVAGIYAGTVDVHREGNTTRAEGSYSQIMHPEAMERALREADTNGDKLITGGEARALYRRVTGAQ